MEIDGGERLGHPLFDLGGGEAEVPWAEGDLFTHRGGEELVIRILEDVAHALRELLERQEGDLPPLETHRSGGGREEPVQVLRERRLAGAVPPDQGDELPLPDAERHVEQRVAAVGVAVAEVADLEQR